MSQGIDVNEDSNMAEIGQAKLINGAMVTQAEVAESSVMVEARQFQGEGSLSNPTGLQGKHEYADALSQSNLEGKNRFNLALDVVLEGTGISMLKTGAEFLKDRISIDVGKNAVHIDDMLSGKSNKKRSIRTAHFNDLSARQKGIEDFAQGESKVKGTKMSETKYAEFLKRRELSVTSKMVNKQKLEMANAAELKVGAKVAKAKQMGMAPGQLALDKMKPKAPNFEEKPIEDDTTAWA